MLVDFTVQNYRSIRDELVLSTVASTRKNDSEAPTPGFYSKTWDHQILPVLAIFGQNGGGKSTIIRALEDALSILNRGTLKEEDTLLKISPIKPFLFDSQSKQEPTKFKLTFLIDEILFLYILNIRGEEIFKEELSIGTPENKVMELIFSREIPGENLPPIWKWGGLKAPLQIPNSQKELIENLQSNRLYLSLLWESFDYPILKKMRDYSSKRNVTFSPSRKKLYRNFVMSKIHKDKKWGEKLQKFLFLFDIPIAKLELNSKNTLISYHQNSSDRLTPIAFADESDGTQHLLSMSASILLSLEEGRLFPLDELDAHMHPHITHQIIRLFQDPLINTKNAQLIFTTHDTTVMDQNLLRRDQVYLVNRGMEGETYLESIADFGVRKDLVLNKAYLEGRFFALPVLKSTNEFNAAVLKILGDN